MNKDLDAKFPDIPYIKTPNLMMAKYLKLLRKVDEIGSGGGTKKPDLFWA